MSTPTTEPDAVTAHPAQAQWDGQKWRDDNPTLIDTITPPGSRPLRRFGGAA